MSDNHDEHLAVHKQFAYLSLTEELLAGYAESFANHMDVVLYGPEWARKSHTLKHPVLDIEQRRAAQAEFLQRWYTLTEEGERLGWLTDDYDQGFAPATLPEFTYETVYDETKEEWEARKALLPKTVTFHVNTDRNVPPVEKS